MKRSSTLLFGLLFFSQALFSQNTGDYRSNVSPTGLWNLAASWQTYDGTDWVAAVAPPSGSNGVITIRDGDSIRLTETIIINQVVVESGAVLAMFNPVTGDITVSLEDDLAVDGRLYVGTRATLSGAGAVMVNTEGSLRVTGSGNLAVDAESNGEILFYNGAGITNATITSNQQVLWISGGLNLSNTTLINNGTFTIDQSSNAVISNTAATNQLQNTATGIIENIGTGGLNIAVPVVNDGIIRGTGEVYLSGSITNAGGTIQPGSPSTAGSLIINPAALHNQAADVNISIRATGGVAGTHYDELVISNRPNAVAVSLANATLTVTGQTEDLIGTQYIIMRTAAVGGPTPSQFGSDFGTLNIPANYTISRTANEIVLTKASVLPLTWGSFTLGENNGSILLSWTTIAESNTSHFVIEHSSDGKAFSSVGTLTAGGNTTNTTTYSYNYIPKPGEAGLYFRIKQVDLDGKSTYSDIRTIRLAGNSNVQVYPNPVQNLLNINIVTHNSRVVIYDVTGRVVKASRFNTKGTQQIDLTGLPNGIYQVSVLEKETLRSSHRIIKQ